jgi:hypothetical protein
MCRDEQRGEGKEALKIVTGHSRYVAELHVGNEMAREGLCAKI